LSSWVGKIQQQAGTKPPWFVRNKNIGRLLQAFALELDNAVETLAQGLRLAHPLRCDASALPIISRDHGISIYPTEPEDSKRQRLANWLVLRRQFGTHQGELRNVLPYFLPARPLMRIVHQNGGATRATWHTVNTDGSYTIHKAEPSNWDWDGVPTSWSRWWAIIYYETALAWLEPAEWNDGLEYGDGTLWDGGPSTDQIRDIVAGLKEAQGTHSALWGVIVTRDPSSFDPTAAPVVDAAGWSSLPIGNWAFAIDNDTGLPSRPPYASLIYQRGPAA
jgi:Phage tail protein (Tail_P2_I)